jgi:DNA-binding GntR family transcriptional regulator
VAKRRLSVTLDPVTLDEQVYRILRDRILHWELGPGQRLDIDELSQSFGVSRTPIKCPRPKSLIAIEPVWAE